MISHLQVIPEIPGPPGKSLRILYADDVVELCDIVIDVLGRDGHRVESVANGHLALERIIAEPLAYHVVITDHHMPRMEGLEFVQRLRALAFPGRIVVFSSELSTEIDARYQELKVDHILPKPVPLAQLREIVGRF